jgi:hypothetical protein
MENLAASPYYPSSEGEIVRPRPPPTDALDGAEPAPPAASASATAQKPVEMPTATAAEVEEPSMEEEEEEPATNSGKAKRNLASAFDEAATSSSNMEKNEDDQVQQQTPVVAIDAVDVTTLKKTVKKKLTQVTYIYKFYPKRDNKSIQDAGELSKYENFIFTHTPNTAVAAEAAAAAAAVALEPSQPNDVMTDESSSDAPQQNWNIALIDDAMTKVFEEMDRTEFKKVGPCKYADDAVLNNK